MDTWTTRDLPVLRAIVEIEEETNSYAMADQIVERTGLTEDQVQRAVGALAREHPRLVSVMDASTAGGTYYAAAGDATGEARRRVGAWPSPEALAERIVAELRDVADNAPSDEERSRARKILDGLGGVGKNVLSGVLVKVLTESV